MANEEHLAILKQGVKAWNQWRRENRGLHPDLSGANLREEDLNRADLRETHLWAADLSGATLGRADLSEADLSGADLSGAGLSGARLSEATLGRANLSRANLWTARLRRARLRETDLSGATLSWADLSEADLRRANLGEAHLLQAILGRANLSGATLSRANLSGANLSRANLSRANLAFANLVEANFADANLMGCQVYGISAWNVNLAGARQSDLVITPPNEPVVTFDNLEVAQFIYMLLHNEKIREVIETSTSKAVLILGRFTPERKAVLDAMREELRNNHGLVPILFDFEPSPKRDLTETIQLLANICRFVVADVTDAKSIPQELSHIIPYIPSVPVQPIILAAQTEYTMFEHWRQFYSVLPEFLYRDKTHLLDNLQACVIKPVERWEAEVKKAAAKERLLQERIKKLEAENAELRGLQSASPDTSG
jgi:uncharacterized protein YjbI with pentapeptide repeats